MASTDPAALVQELAKYVKAVQSDNSLFNKSKCEKYLTDIDSSLDSNPAHAQRKALEKHRIAISNMMSGGDLGGDQSDVPDQNYSEQIPIDHKNLVGLLDQDKLDHIKAKGWSIKLQCYPPDSTPPLFPLLQSRLKLSLWGLLRAHFLPNPSLPLNISMKWI